MGFKKSHFCLNVYVLSKCLIFLPDVRSSVRNISDQEIPESRPRNTSDQKPAAATTTTGSSSNDQAKVDHLKSLGFSEDQARQALQSCNGNADMAAGLLFESSQ